MNLVVKIQPEDSIIFLPTHETNFKQWKKISFELEEPVQKISIQGFSKKNQSIPPLIYGMVLENNESSGILYHTAGVNGAQLIHFNKSDFFVEQTAALNPQLIIISLGTNEVFNDLLDTLSWAKNIETLVNKLREQIPGVCFLFTTPPDSWKGGAPRPLLDPIIRTLYRKAEELDFAVWDFREAMGGKGAMKTWNRANLSQNDLVHLTPTGYNLQGILLIEALEKAQKEEYDH
jgi:lysophospholipase L1-like esterase